MDDSGIPRWERWGRFRYSIIGGLLASPPQGGELTQALSELARKRYRHPTDPGRWVSYGFSTLEKWCHRARNAADPVKALGRRIRRDCGGSQALSPELLAELEALYTANAHWTVKLLYDNLAVLVQTKPQLGPLPAYQTVRKAMLEKVTALSLSFLNQATQA